MTTQLMTQTTTEIEYPEVTTNYIDAKTETTALEKMGLDLTCDNDYRVIFTRIAYEMGDYYADNYDSMVIYETRPACVLQQGNTTYDEF